MIGNSGLESVIRKDRYAEEGVAVIATLSPFEVTFQGEQTPAINAMPRHCHIVGDAVRVLRYANSVIVYATLETLPILGVVGAYLAGTADVTIIAGDDTFDARIKGTGWTPAVGDRVVIDWTNLGPFAMRQGGPVTTPGSVPLPPDNMNSITGPSLPVPPPSPSILTATMYAQQTGCYYLETAAQFTGDQARYWLYSGYRGGEATGDPIDAYWFYGDQVSKIRGATVSKIEMWVQRMAGVGPSSSSPFHLILHDSATKPSTDNTDWIDTREEYFSLSPGQAKWITLPLAWGTQIAAGTAKGVGIVTIYGSDVYKALIGIDHTDPTKRNVQSGALRATYKRS